MTQIKDILHIRLEDDIKNVIDLNLQDEDDILDELDGFILTESLAKHLNDFCDFFTSNTAQPGVWLSGFYGSGKSYFAKMIGFLIKNPILRGTSVRDRFANKLAGLPNESLLRNSINELGRTRNHVVLFDAAKATGNHGISYMMMAAFLKSLNLHDDNVGLIEFNLLKSGRYAQFCDKVQQRYHESWQKRRSSMDIVFDTLRDTMLDGFCTEYAFEQMFEAANRRIQDYDANKLQEDLQSYLQVNNEVRIVFMIDEVSESIAQNRINILDLEGMAEAMAALGRQVWTIAIAQLQLDDVINRSNVNKSLLTKIIDRFRKRINITAEEVDTIIRKRLLAKTAEGEEMLQAYFKKNSGMISDITNLTGTGLKKTTDARTYADYYPFYEHQFKMLQYFLFGTQKLVKTQVGTRGMLISAFDVLRNEALSDRSLYTHVNASQLCRQAEEAVAESLRARYTQANEQLAELALKYISGQDLLQTIHFLTESGAKTTVENICRAYVNRPDDYFAVLEEVKVACQRLAIKEILILSGDEYRITSETQQRIFEKMANYDGVSDYRIKGEIIKRLKNIPFVRSSFNLMVDAVSVPFCVGSDSGENFANAGEQGLKVTFHDTFNVQPSFNEYVERIKDETQAQKNQISIIPTTAYVSEMKEICDRILRIDYIKDQIPNMTAEERQVVDEIARTLDDKGQQLEQLIVKSYTEGQLVYLYNTYNLTAQNATSTVKEVELKMYNNVFTKRLGGTLKDSLAAQLLKVNANQLQNVIGQQSDFLFFDTAGQFIGDQLPVVTEIMAQTATYKSGGDLERDLGAAPTGYSFGTIFSVLAALFRAGKVIIKYNNEEYHAWQQPGATTPFQNSKNFQRASFKAITKTLTYNERRDIVETLKDCHYRELTGESVTYNTTDFLLVEAIHLLAVTEIKKVKEQICSDPEREALFRNSLRAREVLQAYASPVSELNYFSTARTFLNEDDNEEFCQSIEKIESDLRFIASNLRSIERQKVYFAEVKNELEFVGVNMQPFDVLSDHYTQLLEADPVHNFAQMQQEYQKVKDLYYQQMKQFADKMTGGYTELLNRLEGIKSEADSYPHEWNTALYDKVAQKEQSWKKYIVSKIELPDYQIVCSRSHLQLRDMDSAIKMMRQLATELDVLSTEVVTTAPEPPIPQPRPTPGDPKPHPDPEPKPQSKPKVRNLRRQLPSGHLTVAQYKQWLMQQLSMVNQYESTDILKFDE